MRKIFLLLTILLLGFGLAACGDEAVGFPEFDEDNVVELSAQEMVTLFESIDYTSVDSESVRITTKGHIFVKEESDPEDTTYSSLDDFKLTIDASIYALMSEVIGDVRLHGEGTIDFNQVSEYSSEWYEDSSANAMKGSAGIYFVEGYLYMMVDGEYAENGDALEEVSFKQKLNTEVTQTMWDEAMSEVDPETQIDTPTPQEYIDMIEAGDFDELMEAIPSLKVYQDGTTYSIVFTVTKQIVLDSMEDMIVAYAEAMGETMTQAQIDEIITEAETEINNMVDELSFTYVISITGNRITKVAEKLVFKSVDGNIDINMTTVIDFGVDLPTFPNDLDTYDPVDQPGEGYFDDEEMAKS